MTESETQKKTYSSADLETLYREAESCDSELFPEMRSNILLVAGEHYSRRSSSFFKRLRDTKDLTEQQKLRLTKNHVQNIVKKYVNSILSMAPGVGFEPKNESELKDQKAAELHHAVWLDAVDRYDIDSKKEDWADHLIEVGEVATKIFWDPNKGEVKAYEQLLDAKGLPVFHGPDGQPTNAASTTTLDPMSGMPVDQPHQPMADENKPVFSGAMVFEEIYGFNLLRAPEARTMEESPYLIVRKMAKRKDLLLQFPDKAAMLSEGSDETFTVFESSKGGYRRSKNEVLLKEYYFRPCYEYPKGFFILATKDGKLAEGELPAGVFPIVWEGCDRQPTHPRGRSIVKIMRPYQAEINRAGSKIAEHHITLGDDKLIIQNGTKITSGTALPGVRSVNVTGAPPTVLPGRDGSQYVAYMQAEITEMYMVLGVPEQDGQKQNGQMDPYALLFRAASQKKTFQRYAKRFEHYLINVTKTYLKLAKFHMPDDQVIYAIGKPEAVNISEFKNTEDICYEIKVVAESDDIETKMGKQLILNHALQYTANKLDKEDIGKLMRAMPYSNFDESFNDLTIDYDSVTNDLLALDRGQMPQIHEYDNHVYSVKRAVARKRLSDYQNLTPQIQGNYEQYIGAHQQLESQRLYSLQLAESGFIPTGGYLVKCDFYAADPLDPQKTKRISLPAQSVQWLVDKLQSQGQGIDQLEQMDGGSQRMMANNILQLQHQGGPNGMGAPGGHPGTGMPQGVGNGPPTGNGSPGNAGPPGLFSRG